MHLCRDYSHHFIVRGKDVSGHARHYLSGLLGKEQRKNIERIEADVAESDYQGMQQFITDSPWSHEALLAQIAEEAHGLLGGHRDCALYLDESSFVKKGDASVGVQRQYCGRLGKVENCQTGVFACLGRGRHAVLTDVRLFLPEAWAQDEARCDRAKVPEAKRVHLTKPQLALEMVRAAREHGSPHQWIGADAAYGANLSFCEQLEDMGETFLIDMPRDTAVWNADPAPVAPEPSSLSKSKVRLRTRRSRCSSAAQRQRVEALAAVHFEKECRLLTLRETTQGPLRAQLWVREVWQWAPGQARARRRMLVVRKEKDGTFKYSLSNAPADTSWERLGFMQAQRYWIEQAFAEAKGDLGMAHYEVRGWKGWHHHMALVCLALLFTVRERIAAGEAVPLLSTRDITELLASYLPRRRRDEAEVFRQILQRHQRRAAASKAHARKREHTEHLQMQLLNT